MNPTDSSDLLTFPLAPQWGSHRAFEATAPKLWNTLPAPSYSLLIALRFINQWVLSHNWNSEETTDRDSLHVQVCLFVFLSQRLNIRRISLSKLFHIYSKSYSDKLVVFILTPILIRSENTEARHLRGQTRLKMECVRIMTFYSVYTELTGWVSLSVFSLSRDNCLQVSKILILGFTGSVEMCGVVWYVHKAADTNGAT